MNTIRSVNYERKREKEMVKTVYPPVFDKESGKWILRILNMNGYVQVVEFVNCESLENYRSEMIAFQQKLHPELSR
jgi:hypothetical protein